MINLTTLNSVKQYLGITSTGQDALIPALIQRESRQIESWTGRTFPSVSWTNKRLSGTGSQKLMLPDTPVVAVSFVAINGTNLVLSPDGVQGDYLYDDTTLYLTGGRQYHFDRGNLNVVVSWNAGWLASETDVVVANTPLTPYTGGRAVTDQGVVYAASGAALTPATGNLTVGQYAFNATAGTYSFAAADAGNSVAMSYYYVPAPVEQACNEMVGLDLEQRKHLGTNSQSMEGQSTSYTDRGLTPSVIEMLGPYRKRHQ